MQKKTKKLQLTYCSTNGLIYFRRNFVLEQKLRRRRRSNLRQVGRARTQHFRRNFEQKFTFFGATGVVTYVEQQKRGFMPKFQRKKKVRISR